MITISPHVFDALEAEAQARGTTVCQKCPTGEPVVISRHIGPEGTIDTVQNPDGSRTDIER